MRAVVLAAGVGSRISKDVGGMPKSLLQVANKSLLLRSVETLETRGIEVTVCTGYRHQLVEDELSTHQINIVYNPFYAVANNICSLWFAKDVFCTGEDVFVLSADLLYEAKILDFIIQASDSLVMAVDSSRVHDGDYFFAIDDERNIKEFGPAIAVERRSAEYMGISRVAGSFGRQFVKRLDKYVKDDRIQDYFEHVFFSFIGTEMAPKCVDVAGCAWREIDRIEDLEKARLQFGEKHVG